MNKTVEPVPAAVPAFLLSCLFVCGLLACAALGAVAR